MLWYRVLQIVLCVTDRNGEREMNEERTGRTD